MVEIRNQLKLQFGLTEKDSEIESNNINNYCQKIRTGTTIVPIEIVAISENVVVVKINLDGQEAIMKLLQVKHSTNLAALESFWVESQCLKLLKGKGIKIPELLMSITEPTIKNKCNVVGLVYNFLNGHTLNVFLENSIEKDPLEVHHYSPISQGRLEYASKLLIGLMYDLVKTVHSLGKNKIFHFDIRPENILIVKNDPNITSQHYSAWLIDFGSAQTSVKEFDFPTSHRTSVYYSFDELNVILASGKDRDFSSLEMFQIGKTIQDCIQILKNGFGENFWSSYSFSFLDLLRKFLLSNQITIKENILPGKEDKSITDILTFSPMLLREKTIQTTEVLLDKFKRYYDSDYFSKLVPELGRSKVKLINSGLGDQVPITPRIEAVIEHGAFQRLKNEDQVGSVAEIFPNATHNRFSHSIGVYGGTIQYFLGLINDPESPQGRILIDPEDIEHGMLAALLHDIGQSTWGHDFENSGVRVATHESLFRDILNDPQFAGGALAAIISASWGKPIQLGRIEKILNFNSMTKLNNCIDYLIHDIISGPIDADKFDYLVRDSRACGVPYGLSFDRKRFIDALSIYISEDSSPGAAPIALSYKAKGSAAIESLLLARYQMYGAIYWHHTNRSIISMFMLAARSCFSKMPPAKLAKYNVIYKNWVILARPAPSSKSAGVEETQFYKTISDAPIEIRRDRALGFIWVLSEQPIRELVELLAKRKMYKRIFEIRMSELGMEYDKAKLLLSSRPVLLSLTGKEIQNQIITSLDNIIRARYEKKSTSARDYSFRQLENVQKTKRPLVIVDIPFRGVPNEANLPFEINDTNRKYVGDGTVNQGRRWDVFLNMRKMQKQSAMVRVFIDPTLQELVIRYLSKEMILKICLAAIDTQLPDTRNVLNKIGRLRVLKKAES